MRWKAVILTLAVAVATLAGCSQRTFLNRKDFEDFHARNALPLDVDHNPHLGADPITGLVATPPDVNDPERDPRFVSLAECIALALEGGTTGFQSVRQLGAINEDLLALNPGGGVPLTTGSDSIRVLSLNPAIAGLAIDASLARFDAKFVTSVNTGTTDQPIQGFNSFNNGDKGGLTSTLAKELSTGGLAAITFNTNYQNLSSPPRNFPLLNPAYTSRLQATFEQPLWQSFGTAINQLLGRPPSLGTQLSQIDPNASSFLNGHIAGLTNNGNNGVLGNTGILVARIRFDQSRADLERVVNFKLVNCEVAYWNLYGSFVNLYSSEQALRQAYEAWRINKAKYQAGSIAITQFAQTRGQYEQFRGDRLQALGRVLEAERVLRAIIGLPIEDGKRLVPIDAPTLAPYRPDWDTALRETLTLRPELVAARAELKSLQFNLMIQQNFLKPDLRLLSQYGLNGLGSSLDGNKQFLDQSIGRFRSLNDLRILSSGHYGDWSLGLVLNVPLGYRFENAAVRQARLQLAQGFLAVKREEEKARLFLAKTYRDVTESYGLIEARRAQRQAFAEQVEARFKEFVAGKTTADFLLEAQRQFANALSTEYQAVVAYNNALATFQFAKGTIMQHDAVAISEGPLPQCVAVRAVEHERERSMALMVRQVAQPVGYSSAAETGAAGLPQLSPVEAPKLPALMKNAPKLPERLEELPPPTPLSKKTEQPLSRASVSTTSLPTGLELAMPTPVSKAAAAQPVWQAPKASGAVTNPAKGLDLAMPTPLSQAAVARPVTPAAGTAPKATAAPIPALDLLPTPAALPRPAVSQATGLSLPPALPTPADSKGSGPAWPN